MQKVIDLFNELPSPPAAGISAFRASSFYLLVQTSVGVLLEVQLHPVMQVHLTVTSDYQAKICGMCPEVICTSELK